MIVHNNPIIATFVAEALGEEGFGECYTLGNVRDNTLIAGVVFNNYTGLSVQMTAAGTGLWCTHELLNNCFSFAFNGLKCKRITALVARSNTKALKLNMHLGFVEEGVVRMGGDDEDLILLGMLKSECKYI